MGLLAALDTACLLTPRAWATSARERVVSIFPDGGGSDRCQVLSWTSAADFGVSAMYRG